MVDIERSQPEPECLAAEKTKKNGSYRCGDVQRRLEEDFRGKCYICEDSTPTSINVEHRESHREDLDLKFGWSNLFWSCGHCNKIKGKRFDNILDCTDTAHDVENCLEYHLDPMPFEEVVIRAIASDPNTAKTRELLLAVYNADGGTVLSKFESANLRKKMATDIWEFQTLLGKYYNSAKTPEHRAQLFLEITSHLHRGASFAAFKRWIVRRNRKFLEDFGRCLE